MKDIRYSNKGIFFFLLILALMAALISFFQPFNELFQGSESYIIQENINDLVDRSLYGQGINSAYDGAINYYLKSNKIRNYPLTQEYYERFGERVALSPNWNGRTDDWNRYVYLGDYYEGYEEEYGLDPSLNHINNFENPEEPDIVDRYLTNDRAFKRKYGADFKFEPESFKIRENTPYIKGYFDGTGVHIYEQSHDLDTNYKANILADLIDSVQEQYSNIDMKQGIRRIDFLYSVNTDSAGFRYMVDGDVRNSNSVKNAFAGIMISMIILLAFSILTKYEKTKEVGFYKAIYRFPLIVVIGLFMGLLIVSLEFFHSVLYSYGGYPTDDTVIAGVIMVDVIFGGLALLYVVQAIKSLVLDGKESFIVRHSIIRWVFSLISKFYKSLTADINITDRKYILLVFIGLLLLGYLGAAILVPYYTFLAVVLWTILIVAGFWALKRVYLDLRVIEDKTQEVSNGNFDTVIDVDNNRFKLLANNLNSLSDSLNLAIDDAIKSEKMRTELITNVSHDLKTPLTSIINYSELLEAEEDIEKVREYSSIINEKSHKLKVLIEDLFQVSKLSSGNADINLERLNFYQLVEQVLGEWEDKLAEKNLDVIFKSSSKEIFLDLDGHQFSRVLDNLFSNIYKYSMEGTRVYVDLSLGDKLVLALKNISEFPLNISPEELTQRFIRGDESRTTEGSGLGLSIASSLVDLQGGKFLIDIDGDLFKIEIVFDRPKDM